MFQKHKTKDGRKMLICEMTNRHLSNTISMLLTQLRQVNDALDGNAKFNATPSQIAMRGVRKASLDFDELAKMQRIIVDKLYPYLAEAFLRGMFELIEEVQAAFGRNAQADPIGAFHTNDGTLLITGSDALQDDLDALFAEADDDDERPF